jgi:hypothetical protein
VTTIDAVFVDGNVNKEWDMKCSETRFSRSLLFGWLQVTPRAFFLCCQVERGRGQGARGQGEGLGYILCLSIVYCDVSRLMGFNEAGCSTQTGQSASKPP